MAGTPIELGRPLEATGFECSMRPIVWYLCAVVVTSAADVATHSGHTDEIHPAEPSTQHKAGET